MTLPKLSSLTPEQIRVMIAEACGWSFVPGDGGKTDWLTQVYFKGEWKFQTTGGFGDFVPDYLSDLNAMHEAEKVLKKSNQFAFLEYQRALWRVVTGRDELNPGIDYMHSLAMWDVTCATTTQRAHAFLLACGRATL